MSSDSASHINHPYGSNSKMNQSPQQQAKGLNKCFGFLQGLGGSNNINGVVDATYSNGSMHEMSMTLTNNHEVKERRDSSISGSLGSSFDTLSNGGPLTQEQRQEKIRRYWDKKKRRKSQKFVRYECR